MVNRAKQRPVAGAQLELSREPLNQLLATKLDSERGVGWSVDDQDRQNIAERPWRNALERREEIVSFIVRRDDNDVTERLSDWWKAASLHFGVVREVLFESHAYQ